jgi:putative multiple sugar transport system permease protein
VSETIITGIPDPEAAAARSAFWKSNIRDYGLLVSLLLIMAFFEIVTGGVLFRGVNVTNLILQNSYIVIMALGMLLVIVGGNIDLSVGSIVGFVGGVAATMMVGFHVPWLEIDVKIPWEPVILLSLVLGAIIGAAQGYFIAYSKIPAFIVTLAGMLIFRGLTGNMLQGQFVGPFAKGFQAISAGFIPDFSDFGIFKAGEGQDQFFWLTMLIGIIGALLMVYTSTRRWKRDNAQSMETEPFPLFVGKNAIFAALILGFSYLLASNKGLPNVLVIMGVLILLYTFATTRMTIGRRIYAMGGNRLAAQLSGIRTERLTFLTFVNMGMLAGLAGLIVAARLNSATPSAGNSFELDVIAACFIGGVSASGGVGKVMGVVIGAFFMGVMNNGMSILGIGIFWQQVVKGIVLLAAVYVDVYQKNKG